LQNIITILIYNFMYILKGSSDEKFTFIWFICLHLNVSLQCVDTITIQ